MAKNGGSADNEAAGGAEDDLKFPALPPDENPEDDLALKRVISGQRSVGELYRVLITEIEGEHRCLVRLLYRDWERRFGELIEEGVKLLAQSIAVSPDQIEGTEARPDHEEIEGHVKSHPVDGPRGLFALVQAFASRSFACARLVPWKSDARKVFEFFVRCVDAEDQHVGLTAQLAELVD